MASGHGFIFCRFIHARFPHLVVHNAYILKRSTRGDVIGVPQDKAPGHVLNGAYDSDGFLGHLFPAAAQEETGGGAALYLAGGPQLRAAGTIGGNVCNGITSADTASTLVALDAVLRVRGPKGEREVPISQWYQGVGKVALAPYELLVKIVIPYDNYVGYTGHYIKYAQRNAMDIATLGVSCLVKLTSDKKMVDDAALAFGVAGPVPMRSPAAEAAVRGLPIGEAVAAIGEAALADVNPRTSWRASKEFRIQLVKELSARSLREAARKGGADV